MLEAIRNREAVAATDASMNGDTLATYQILSTKLNEEECSGGVNTNKQEEAMMPAGEAIELLDLIVNVKENT